MKKVHFFGYGFVNKDITEFTKGGVQTYLLNLKIVFNNLNYEVHFYKAADVYCEKKFQGIHFHLVKSNKRKASDRIKHAFHQNETNIDKKNDIVLFADDSLSFPLKGYKVIILQHGIFWDIPIDKTTKNFIPLYIKKLYNSIKRIRHSLYCNVMVCVDYNYQNWYRAVMPYTKAKLVVNPNFTMINKPISKPHGTINIMFARRFEIFRGTRVFGEAITRILKEYDNVKITIAGWGTDEKWFKEKLSGYGNVEFTKYNSEDSLQLHEDKHIAVVPTIGSEGTSLSLLEAMSAQCAVIGSDVGGITNIIIDKYNGLMTPAGDIKALYHAIKFLIDNPQEMYRMAETGYNTVKYGFSHEKWTKKWVEIIKDIEKVSL